jgi:hypothetical protein
MSRGPGRWQRTILTALQQQAVMYLREVLPSGYTTAQRLACLRAAHRLAEQRKISLSTGWATIIARANLRITWDIAMRLQLQHEGLSEAEINERRAIQQQFHTQTAIERLRWAKNGHDVPWYDALLTVIGDDLP